MLNPGSSDSLRLGDNATKQFGFSVRTDTTQKNKFISSPYNFPYSGYYDYGGWVSSQGSLGTWWSRSAATQAGQAYYFYLDTDDSMYPQNYYNVGLGFAVRCVAE